MVVKPRAFPFKNPSLLIVPLRLPRRRCTSNATYYTSTNPRLVNQVFNRFAVTREINEGLLAPRFSPSQRAWVPSGEFVKVDPSVPASAGRDTDDR